MFRNRSSTLIRLGILALPTAGLLGLVGLLSRYSVPNPRVDPEAAARFASSGHYFASQFAGNVVGLTLLIFGILALTAFLSETRVRGLSLAAMILSIAASRRSCQPWASPRTPSLCSGVPTWAADQTPWS